MLRAMHAGDPLALGEDFAGAGAISRAWVAMSRKATAVAVDHDPAPLARLARARAGRRLKAIEADVMEVSEPADIIAVLNFSICEMRTRRSLLRYLKHARKRLNANGVLVLDIYGGDDAFVTGRIADTKALPGGGRVRYEWEQRHADPLSARVVNAMHFTVRRPGEPVVKFPDAFVYDWRLWSIPELREALEEAGFASSEVYPRFADAQDHEGNLYVSPIESAAELGASYSVYVVGRV